MKNLLLSLSIVFASLACAEQEPFRANAHELSLLQKYVDSIGSSPGSLALTPDSQRILGLPHSEQLAATDVKLVAPAEIKRKLSEILRRNQDDDSLSVAKVITEFYVNINLRIYSGEAVVQVKAREKSPTDAAIRVARLVWKENELQREMRALGRANVRNVPQVARLFEKMDAIIHTLLGNTDRTKAMVTLVFNEEIKALPVNQQAEFRTAFNGEYQQLMRDRRP